MATVEVIGVKKSWGSSVALEGITFTAEAGTLVALLGPSGCGKSTTLRLIAGLDTATDGKILINGKDVTDLPPAKRGVSMVFQSYALFPHLTVKENILFGLKVRKVPAAEQQARLKRAAEILGLEKLLDRKPSQLSGGQQQRVALGRAIVAETPVCLMDEPLSNLDAKLRNEMRREIRALQQRLGITMLYVTHDQVEAMTMADQVVLMNAGHIEQDGTPEMLYERPATIFTAQFIGTPPMNILKFARIEDPDGWLARLTVPDRDRSTIALGVRPESLRIEDQGLPATVQSVEYLGADSLIETTVNGERAVVRASGNTRVRPGDVIRLAWDSGATHWFDLSSGFRIG
ncbi:MAG: ABC transporter ATP-binding protein [Hyphomicrobiaceae bacterium]